VKFAVGLPEEEEDDEEDRVFAIENARNACTLTRRCLRRRRRREQKETSELEKHRYYPFRSRRYSCTNCAHTPTNAHEHNRVSCHLAKHGVALHAMTAV